jgi:imidazoleglycerol-phosphate dehydratase
MLDLVARHGRFDLEVQVTGDLQTGAHHTVEDTGIVLGQALDQALGDRRGIVRYGHAVIPMDEARAACTIDVSGRPFGSIEGFDRLPAGDIAGFEHELAEEFFRAVASAAKLTLHLDLQAGTNAHHMIEASFKAFARALRAAVADDPTETGVPSTKGTLT